MTRNRSNRGRHRRNRGRPTEAPPQEGAEVAIDTVAPPPVDAEPPRPPQQRPATEASGRGQDASRPPRPAMRPRGEADSAQRPGRSGRRRQQRRQQVVPITGEVLKARAPVSGRNEPVQKRPIEDMDGPEGPVLGCPMLTRTRLGLPFTGGRPAPRCALAWAIHSEQEARYCMETHDLVLCWKAHPEQLDEIRARLGEQASDRAAD